MKVLVCGGRNYSNYKYLSYALDQFHKTFTITKIIEGGARGADSLARKWAEENGIPVSTFPARWKEFGNSAGYIRNSEMLTEGKPDAVIAFPGGKGTANMVKLSKQKHNVSVYELK